MTKIEKFTCDIKRFTGNRDLATKCKNETASLDGTDGWGVAELGRLSDRGANKPKHEFHVCPECVREVFGMNFHENQVANDDD